MQTTAAADACIADVMTWTSLTIPPDCTAAQALESLVAAEAEELFVVDRDQVFLGILPDFELLKAELNGSLDEMTAEQLMQRRPLVVSPECRVSDAAKLFREGQLSRAPVVRDGRLIGVVQRRDLLRWIAHQRCWEKGPAIHAPKFLSLTNSALSRSSLAVDA